MWSFHFIVFAIASVALAEDNHPSARTTAGLLEGKIVTGHNGKQVEVFLGIRYAQAPTGDLRFSPPVPEKAWEGVRQAHQPGSECPQLESVDPDHFTEVHQDKNEDCLFLNVWTPHPRPENASILVFFHGFANRNKNVFHFGSGAMESYDGTQLAEEQGLIVVTTNYRLGEFGFLYLGVPEVPGNVGLMDQQLALKWVQENAAAFGGDHHKVTAFGDNCGAFLVGFQAIIPSGKNLFQNMILLDGNPIINEGYSKSKKHSLQLAHTLVEALGCQSNEINEILTCLRSKSVKDIMLNSFKVAVARNEFFSTVVDGVLIPDKPTALIDRDAFFPNLNVMIGVTHHKGSLMYHWYLHQPLEDNFYINGIQFRDLITRTMDKSSDLANGAIADIYTDWEDPHSAKTLRNRAIEFVTDATYICPANRIAEHMVKSGDDVYLFYFDQRLAKANYPEWAGLLDNEYIDLIFGHADSDKNYTKEEHDFSHEIMDYIGNFVRTGNPNQGRHGKWERYNLRNKPYLELKIGGKLEHHLKTRQCTFFERGYKRLLAADELISNHCK